MALPAVEIQVAATLPRVPATARPAADIPVAEVTAVAAVAVNHTVAVVVHTEVVAEAVAVTPAADTVANCDLTLAPHSRPFSRLWRI
jgi:hypothetical protein